MMTALMLAGLLVAPPPEPTPRGAGLRAVLRELWSDDLSVTVGQIHFGRGPKREPGSIAFTLSADLTPRQGSAPVDTAALRKFLDRWGGAVKARGVKMEVEQIVAVARTGKSVSLRITGLLP
jgi:hypothetical protein